VTPDEEAALAELTEALQWELDSPHPLEAIADRLGMSVFAVLRLEKKALDKLRDAAEAKGLDDFEDEHPLQQRYGDEVGSYNGQTRKRLF
jgi:hypothetical protein